MSFISTRGQAPPADLRRALMDGLAPDGGLYVPATLRPLEPDAITELRGAGFHDVAAAFAPALFGDDLEPATLRAILADALNFDIPLVEVEPGVSVLELFHGPTYAFKDVGARTMARLMAHFHAGRDALTVLVATSGDTGSAVAQAFFGVPGTRVIVLYPDGQVTPVQEAQFTTLGGNVTAVAVEGSFDDCQQLVKAAFADRSLRSRVRLTSANSINIGRLLPQALYYAWAALEMDARLKPSRSGTMPSRSGTMPSRSGTVPSRSGTAPARPGVVVSVPSGNFGNLMAGMLAQRLGAPIARFVAATGINDVVPQYLATGVLEPRPSRRTVANAMDVGNPSNVERMRWLVGDDVARLRALVLGSVHTDDEVTSCIGDLWRRRGYLCDPHSAIGYLGTRAVRNGGEAPPVVFLATAHPAKFREVVEPASGTAVPLPPALAEAVARKRQVVQLAPDLDDLRTVICA